jgi:hypothetical protein
VVVLRAACAALVVVATVAVGVVGTPAPAHAASRSGTVLINELVNGGPRSDSDSFAELRNWGEAAVDLTGWALYRCNSLGLRANMSREESPLSGIVLEPGQIFTISKIGMPGDAHISSPYDLGGFGLYLEAPGKELADAVGVYPNEPWPTQSECSPAGTNLPNVLDFAVGESWQRVAASGDPDRDFVAAAATPGEPNARQETTRAPAGVVVSEFAPAGPASPNDEFVELLNAGTAEVDLSGWELYRCSATGRLRPDTLQLTIADGTTLKPGGYWVAGGTDFSGTAQAGYGTGLAEPSSGVLLRNARGETVDKLSVSAYRDSACQDGDEKLAPVLDSALGESYQLAGDDYLVAERTPARRNARVGTSALDVPVDYAKRGVAISEIATDPASEELPAGITQRNYIELGNYGDTAVDLGGWTVRRCEASGIRSSESLTVPRGTRLQPGDSYLLAKAGTQPGADAEYPTALSMLGTGVWIADAAGRRIDSVGVFHQNEMDSPIDTFSPCTKGLSLTTYQPDRLLSETFQRTRFTGVDADDFVVRKATPGVIDEIEWVDPTARVAATAPRAEPVSAAPPAEQRGTALEVVESWAGATENGRLVTERGDGERRNAPETPAKDDRWAYPYQRLVLDASSLKAGSSIHWYGSTLSRNELQLSVWTGTEWRMLDAGTGGNIELTGELETAEIRDGLVEILVQDGPRTERTLAEEADGAPEDPADYDLAISHLTDSQYLSESYPEVYAQAVSWIAANAGPRKIEFASHTGDLVQNWVDPSQPEERARHEFERASAVQSILDDAGVPNSVLPGNHDNKRGVDDSLFNEFFPPSRYEETTWYGGSIASGDNSANFSTFEHDGARFLMLSLPYAYGEQEIAWASEIVTGHPDHNVVISTHEHVTPKTVFEGSMRSTGSRWVSRGGQLWDRVIAPNRNVTMVLSGHFHGLGRIVTENAGGIEGHSVTELLADYQEFRTHTGERATGFQRLLQLDLAGGEIAVDTFSVRLDASASFDYDYMQFLPDNGLSTTPSNARPWNIVEAGVQGRYSAEDDEFAASASFQYPKSVATSAVTGTPKPTSAAGSARARAFGFLRPVQG